MFARVYPPKESPLDGGVCYDKSHASEACHYPRITQKRANALVEKRGSRRWSLWWLTFSSVYERRKPHLIIYMKAKTLDPPQEDSHKSLFNPDLLIGIQRPTLAASSSSIMNEAKPTS